MCVPNMNKGLERHEHENVHFCAFSAFLSCPLPCAWMICNEINNMHLEHFNFMPTINIWNVLGNNGCLAAMMVPLAEEEINITFFISNSEQTDTRILELYTEYRQKTKDNNNIFFQPGP